MEATNFIYKSKSWIGDKMLKKAHKRTFWNNENNSHYNFIKTEILPVDSESSPLPTMSCKHRKQLLSQKLRCSCSDCVKERQRNQKPHGLLSLQNMYNETFNFQKKEQRPQTLWSDQNVCDTCSHCEKRQRLPQPMSLRDFKFGKLLGTGKFSKVFMAKERMYGSQVAIKVLDKSNIKHDKLEYQVDREINIQRKLKHPNIVQLFTHFSDKDNIYLVLEYVAGGEVYRHLRNSPMNRFCNYKAAKYIYQVADAVEYCHKRGVIHRDIKPENLILSLDGNIKLSDFGWSVRTPNTKRKTLCGTLDYIAPEMINREYYDERVDNWCMGILCYEFLVGNPPFQSKDDNKTFRKINDLDIQYPDFMCYLAKDLISRLLRKNPYNRLSLSDLQHHEWIVSKMPFCAERISEKTHSLCSDNSYLNI